MTTPSKEPGWDSVAAIAGGDPVFQRTLTDSLKLLRERDPDPAVRKIIDDIADGKITLREATRLPAFQKMMERGMESAASRWKELSPQERLAETEAGRQAVLAERAKLGLPPGEAGAPIHDFPAAEREYD